MDKIDRLGWATGISVISYGVRVGIRTNKPEIMNALTDRLPTGWKPAASPVVEVLYSVLAGGRVPRSNVRRFNVLYGNIDKLTKTMDLEELLQRFETELQLYVAEYARRRVFVHAGAVGWKGRAILIPGTSFSGKTTLVTELLRAGATYYSDEYAVLDSRGRVHAYSGPLSIRKDPTKPGIKYPVEMLGGERGTRPLPVALIVSTKYQAGARWKPRVLSRGHGILEVLKNTVPARWRPEIALSTLEQVASSARAIKSTRGEAREAADSILEIVDSMVDR
jgi:hypothetical protein